MKEKLVKEIKLSIKEFYGKNIKESKDYGRIINDKHTKRLSDIIDRDKDFIIYGGEVDEQEKFIAPTLIEAPTTEVASMEDELFGPILPIIEFSTIDEAISMIKQFEKPLAFYIFSNNKTNISKLKNNVLSGNITINDTVKHIINHSIPFGGVGQSGMGGYHGIYSFKTFSHERGIYENTLKHNIKTMLPPYNRSKLAMIKKLFK